MIFKKQKIKRKINFLNIMKGQYLSDQVQKKMLKILPLKFITELLIKIELIINRSIISQKSNKKMNRMHSHQQIKKNVLQMRKSTSLEFISSSLSHMQYLIGILKCPLCKEQVKQAHMCPSCCKLYCQVCIKNQIVYKKPQCPNCNKPLRYTSPIYCQGLAKQIQDAITKTASEINSQSKQYQSPYDSKGLSGIYSTPDLYTEQSRVSFNSANSQNHRNLCPQHQLKLQYYCETCSVGVCSDCAVLSNKHQAHRLCKYSHKRLKFKEGLDTIIKNISACKKDLIKKRQEKSEIIQNINRIQLQKIQLSKQYIKRIYQSINSKLNYLVDLKSLNFNSMKHRISYLNGQFNKMQAIMQNDHKVNLIKKGKTYEQQIRKFMYNQLKLISFKKDNNIQHNLIPSFGSKTFILDNYKYLKQKKDLLYSQPLFWKGIQWKLRIFPGGIDENESQKFLALYLQMSRGHRQPNIYKYEILLINQIDRSKAIGCAFQNQFEQGTYWGLDKFANIAFLESQKFIHPTHGYLEIVLNVKSPSFYHAVKDQNYFISQRLNVYKQNVNILKDLRKRAGKKVFDLPKKFEISKNVQAIVEKQIGGRLKQKRRNSI